MARILMFAASLRKGSLNKKLIRVARRCVETLGQHEIDFCEFNDFPMPIYDGDLQESQGLPEGVKKLVKKIEAASAIIISTPEYNGGIPGSLKNAIDWVSRAKPDPWPGKNILLLGASPGGLGAVRGLWHTRVPFAVVGSFVYPEMFGLSQAHEAFDEKGDLKNSQQLERLNQLIQKFLNVMK